jgi:hypothetical protein
VKDGWFGIVAVLGAMSTILLAQPLPQFEVASIKPHPVNGAVFRMPGPGNTGLRTTGNTFTEQLANVQTLIMDAYDVRDFQVSGLPEWATSPSDLYDLTATVAEGLPPTSDQLRRMLQALLADHFQLRVHRETKEVPVYGLVVAKGGLKLKSMEGSADRGIGIQALIRLIALYADRPVIDRTGLTQGFGFIALDNEGLVRSRKVNDAGPSVSIYTEIEEKWGLKLEPQKGPMDMWVVDHVERPSEN